VNFDTKEIPRGGEFLRSGAKHTTLAAIIQLSKIVVLSIQIVDGLTAWGLDCQVAISSFGLGTRAMSTTYFKRYRMEIDLYGRAAAMPPSPPGYSLVPWHRSLIESHAEAKFQSFRWEIDATVFPCLGELDGCRRLMSDITQREGFLPSATWLVACAKPRGGEPEYCGTVQGLRDSAGLGAIQNLGVVPAHRGLGLGRLLMHKALEGFRRAGLSRAYLEVTAQNEMAVRMYQRLGFVKARTLYKQVEVAYH
jgi:GNAT superfamily N-acetyltransferase